MRTAKGGVERKGNEEKKVSRMEREK